MSRPLALITGATSGIGEAAARLFAQKGYDLIITGRRADRLQRLKSEFSIIGAEVCALNFDVRQRDETFAQLEALPENLRNIDVLINNAGLARGFDPIDKGLVDDWEEMIDTNIKGLLYVSKIVSGWMKARGVGHIIHIGSTAGKEAYPNGAVYCATKHAVDALAKGMRMDLLGTGVKVSAVHPALTETEFSQVRFHGDVDRAKKVYDGMQPLTPEDIADTLYYIASAPRHVNIADVVLMSIDQASSVHVYRRDS